MLISSDIFLKLNKIKYVTIPLQDKDVSVPLLVAYGGSLVAYCTLPSPLSVQILYQNYIQKLVKLKQCSWLRNF